MKRIFAIENNLFILKVVLIERERRDLYNYINNISRLSIEELNSGLVFYDWIGNLVRVWDCLLWWFWLLMRCQQQMQPMLLILQEMSQLEADRYVLKDLNQSVIFIILISMYKLIWDFSDINAHVFMYG